MDERYLGLGVTGIGAADEPFMAHFGAALLAAWWLDHDHPLHPAVGAAMSGQADLMVAKHRHLFDVVPGDATSVPADPAELLHDLRPFLDGVWAIGHDVIYVALTLRTFERRPELCTHRVLDGLHAALAACHRQPMVDVAQLFDVSGAGADELPFGVDDVADVKALARVALETAVGFEHVYPGLHQGDIGHILDHGHALLTLERLGRHAEAAAGRRGFLTHVAALRRTWSARADLPEIGPTSVFDARSHAYWDRSFGRNDWAVGHLFKYPYALLDLGDLVDGDLADAAWRRVGQLVV